MPPIPESVAVTARAKIIWGASPDAVLQFLKSNDIEEKDALALIEEFLTERAELVRREGVAKVWSGALLALVPVGYFLFAMLIDSLRVKLFAALIVVGLFGAFRLANGLSMMINPRSVGGNLSDTDEI